MAAALLISLGAIIAAAGLIGRLAHATETLTFAVTVTLGALLVAGGVAVLLLG